MSALETLRAKQSEIQSIAAKHGAGNLRVFGSVARGDAREDSDIDLLIDIVGPTTPWFSPISVPTPTGSASPSSPCMTAR